MADSHRAGLVERDIDQAITALKKGAYLLKYGRRGKPKFCPFRLSADESMLIWYYGKEEKQLELRHVSRIIPGQRTAIFQRYPRPEKEYQSFSLIYSDRSLDLICKDKDEAEVWFVGLKALILRGSTRKFRGDAKSDSTSSDSPRARRNSPTVLSSDQGEAQQTEIPPRSSLGRAFSEIISYTGGSKSFSQVASDATNSLSSLSSNTVDNSNGRTSAAETVRVSLSSAVSSSSQGSCREDFDALGDIFIWGEGLGDGVLGGGIQKVGHSSSKKMDALLPRALGSTVFLDVHNIACGGRHAVLVTRQGEIFSWGEEFGGRLGHGVVEDISFPKLIDTLSGLSIELVACGEYHTCAVTLSGDLYTWGDGGHNSGLLGHGSEVSHWIPKKVNGLMEGIHISCVSCGPWHTALVTSTGQLFTFGDGTFGALGHGDHSSTNIPREVETLRGQRTVRVACGVWHTAAVVEVITDSFSSPSENPSSGKLFTWGDGDKGQLGHGDKERRLLPMCVTALLDKSVCRVACGNSLTVALTTSGRVYTMGSTVHGQLGCPAADGKIPTCVEGKIADSFVEEVACGSHHVAILTSKAEVYTWGKGANGQLGHGDIDDRNTPTLVDSLKDKQVKSVECGSNFTAIICVHKWVSSTDNSVCSGCHNPFNFRRKRHNCYNCGFVFCKACSSRKSLKASLAPSMNKPYRVCDDCFSKLKKAMESSSVQNIMKIRSASTLNKSSEVVEKETGGPRLQGQVSRLSSVGSFAFSESRNSKLSMKVESKDSNLLPLPNGNNRRGSISFFPRAPSSVSGASKSLIPVSTPCATSPPRKSNSPESAKSTQLPTDLTSELGSEGSKHTNENVSEEVRLLKAQVEDLTSKSRLLEAELEKTTKQLKEATALAEEEAEKRKAAKEVIKTLTFQLKDMAERVPEGSAACSKLNSVVGHTLSNPYSFSNESNGASIASPKGYSSIDNSINSLLPMGTRAQNDRAEWVVQDEPGVYITLSTLPGGGNELKRVRFSRKRFTEEQAEKWWAKNGDQVCERYSIRTAG